MDPDPLRLLETAHPLRSPALLPSSPNSRFRLRPNDRLTHPPETVNKRVKKIVKNVDGPTQMSRARYRFPGCQHKASVVCLSHFRKIGRTITIEEVHRMLVIRTESSHYDPQANPERDPYPQSGRANQTLPMARLRNSNGFLFRRLLLENRGGTGTGDPRSTSCPHHPGPSVIRVICLICSLSVSYSLWLIHLAAQTVANSVNGQEQFWFT